MANRPEEFPVFTPLGEAAINLMSRKIENYLGNVGRILRIHQSEILVAKDILAEIITRVEKRRVYFHIFYDCEMGELNEGALLAFWILKLCPFFHPKIPSRKLNVQIAITLFVTSVVYYAQQCGKRANITSQFVDKLGYSLTYRDISKESLMILAESLIV
jgi:hypothetical protein